MENKKCRKCLEYKPLTDFHRNKTSNDGRQSSCKPCNQARAEEWQRTNKEQYEAGLKRRASEDKYELNRKLRKYGITEEDYNELLRKSEGACMICKLIPLNWLVIDHCHSTHVVRGLLCGNCNTALGLLKDSQENLTRAIEYLASVPVAAEQSGLLPR